MNLKKIERELERAFSFRSVFELVNSLGSNRKVVLNCKGLTTTKYS